MHQNYCGQETRNMLSLKGGGHYRIHFLSIAVLSKFYQKKLLIGLFGISFHLVFEKFDHYQDHC